MCESSGVERAKSHKRAGHGPRPVQLRAEVQDPAAADAAAPDSGRGTPEPIAAGTHAYASTCRPVVVTFSTPLTPDGPDSL